MSSSVVEPRRLCPLVYAVRSVLIFGYGPINLGETELVRRGDFDFFWTHFLLTQGSGRHVGSIGALLG